MNHIINIDFLSRLLLKMQFSNSYKVTDGESINGFR